MADLTDEQRLAYVRALLDNPVLGEVFEEMRAATIEVFEKSAPDQVDEREKAAALSRAIFLLKERVNRKLIELTGETQT